MADSTPINGGVPYSTAKSTACSAPPINQPPEQQSAAHNTISNSCSMQHGQQTDWHLNNAAELGYTRMFGGTHLAYRYIAIRHTIRSTTSDLGPCLWSLETININGTGIMISEKQAD